MAKTLIIKVALFVVALCLLGSCSSPQQSVNSNGGTLLNLTWKSSTFNAPKNSALFGIDCITSSVCITVVASNLSTSAYSTSTAYKPAIFYSKNAGDTWDSSNIKLPVNITTGIIDAIGCSKLACIAVGGSDPSGSGVPIALISTNQGESFSPVNVSQISSGSFDGIYCYSQIDVQNKNNCILVGNSGTTTNTNNLIVKLTLTNLAISMINIPSKTNSYINALSCNNNSYCVALGGFTTGSQTNNSEILVSNNDGTSFTVATFKSLPQTLLAVTCSSTQNCFIAGAGNTSLNSLGTPVGYPSIYEFQSQDSVSLKQPLILKSSQGLMTSIYCLNNNLSQCIAIGGQGSSKSFKSVISYLKNGTWQTQDVSIADINLYSITCIGSSNSCIAVGNQTTKNNQSVPEVFKLNL